MTCKMKIKDHKHFLMCADSPQKCDCSMGLHFKFQKPNVKAVASLGLVSPGAAIQCHPYFFWKKLRTFLLITVTFYFTGFHSGITPGGYHPGPFLPVQPRFTNVHCKFCHIFYSGVTPWRVSPGAVRPRPLVTPLCQGHRYRHHHHQSPDNTQRTIKTWHFIFDYNFG